jgi:hypothetical protein
MGLDIWLPSMFDYNDGQQVQLVLVTVDTGGGKKMTNNPMNQHFETRLRNLRRAKRCGAKTRAGLSCQRPALRGRSRCRLHGGLSPGAPRGVMNGNYRSGDWTAEAVEERRWLRSMVRISVNGGRAE